MAPAVLDSQFPPSTRFAEFYLCCVFIFLSFITVPLSSAQINNTTDDDRQALLCFKSGISHDPTGALASWRNDSLNFCGWKGVNCSTTLPVRVVSIDLRSLQLGGQLSNCIATLTSLVRMDISNNDLSGKIPDGLGSLPRLETLMLTGNSLEGSIPASLGNASSLSSILLALNNLRGAIPVTLGQILKLNILDLSNNFLSGSIPAMLYNVSSLISFDVSNNRLAGQIPSDIGNSLPNLESLILSGNAFYGVIPASLANMLKLQVIDLSSNLLSGSVPSLGSLRNLNQLLLGTNMLQSKDWSFLTSLTNCSQLSWFSMDQNVLNGSLPKSVGNLSTKLERLNFGGNKISGTIPAEIGNLVNLTLLEMDQNRLSGIIPYSIGDLKKLVVLRLSKNRLSGEIPTTIGNSPQLNKLYLDDNMLSGNIPESLGQCTRLSMLNLSVNKLDGSIPSKILSISSLSLGLDLSNNNLTGMMPPQIGNLINLELLNVSNNMLSGEIPPELGSCAVLSSLQMENNMLSGTIPEMFQKLRAIHQIDLSKNNLYGSVPEFFENFTTLYNLNISYNKLEGPIPTAGIFKNSNAVALEGNKALCQYIPIFALPLCPTTSVTKRKINARLLMIMVPPVTIALLSLLYVVATILTGSSTKPAESFKETMKKVSYRDILKATNWFSPVNRISSSHTASVYIGRFEFDTDLVAIKVFHLDEQGSLNSFFTECDVLKHTRHRNLIQAITSCSTVDFENNEFKALVYEFMANGSLDLWLYPRLHQGITRRVLSLGQRITVAANVASALHYLHNQLTPPLIHCDLKPSNVLLDYDMTSRIGDFGSAMCLSSSLNSSPEGFIGARGTIGYIAPEYGMGCKISTSGDVYSFGVLLLEMLTAKRPTDTLFVNGLSLHKYVDSAFPSKINNILDPQMPREDGDVANLCMQKYIIPLVQIGLMCSMESPKERPGMRDVCAKIMDIQEAFVQTF